MRLLFLASAIATSSLDITYLVLCFLWRFGNATFALPFDWHCLGIRLDQGDKHRWQQKGVGCGNCHTAQPSFLL